MAAVSHVGFVAEQGSCWVRGVLEQSCDRVGTAHSCGMW